MADKKFSVIVESKIVWHRSMVWFGITLGHHKKLEETQWNEKNKKLTMGGI